MRTGGIRQKRSLGQVFLTVQWPIERIVEILKTWESERVLEIGPGGGVLTRGLLEAGFDVTSVEKDDRFAELLGEIHAAPVRGKFEIVNEDFLEYDLEAWLGRHAANAICGNIPYNISTPILEKLLPVLPRLKGVVLMTQLEFAKRLAATPGNKDYGSLSVFAQLRSEIELAFQVPKGCFRPVPKVDSAVVTLRPKANPYDEATLAGAERICRAAFQQRRKQLRNSLAGFLTDSPPADIDLSQRPETLSPEDFVRLAQALGQTE